jgi:cytochrome c-type biogenesis protein CcmH/NrfF
VFILERVERCQSKQQIKAALATEFGDQVLALPEDEGFDLAAYVVPAIGLAAGLIACAFAVARWRRTRPGAAPGSPALAEDGARGADPARGDPGPEANARLERDLERYDA